MSAWVNSCRVSAAKVALMSCLILAQTGCLTRSTLERAKPHDCKYSRITEVTNAAISPEDLFVRIRVADPSGTKEEDRVLSIPLNSSAWLRDKRGKPVRVDSSIESDELQVHRVAGWFLHPGDAIPSDAEVMPVASIETDNLGELHRKAAEVSRNVQVLSVKLRYPKHEPGESDVPQLTRRDPLIAILSRTGPEGWQTALIISDVCESCEQEKKWYLMTPLAVAGDIVTFPLQVVVFGAILAFVRE